MCPELQKISRDEFAEQLHISYSQLKTFLMCPQKHAYQYRLGAEWERKSAALPFGSACHRAVEAYYRHFKKSGEMLTLEAMVAVFDKVLDQQILNSEIDIVFKDGENLASLREQGLQLLGVFHKEVKPQKIIGVEVPFSVKIPDPVYGDRFSPVQLVGIFDLVEADVDGSYVVVELKTSGQRYSNVRLETDVQSTVYAYALTQMGLATSGSSTLVRYDVLLKQKNPALARYYVSRTEEDYRKLIQLLNQVLKALDLKVAFRLEGWQCRECPFFERCMNDI